MRGEAGRADLALAQLRDDVLTHQANLLAAQEEHAINLQLSDREHRHRLATTITTVTSEQAAERAGTVAALNERLERETEAHAQHVQDLGDRCAARRETFQQ